MANRLVPTGGNDVVYTPDILSKKIVEHFRPQIRGKILEPCYGGGSFVRALEGEGFRVTGLELEKGSDFFDYRKKVDWIITNPPWSKARDFLIHSYEISDNVVFLITLHHVLCLRARIRDMGFANFGLKEVVICDTPPKPWPQSGFQLGAIHIQRNFSGNIKWGEL